MKDFKIEQVPLCAYFNGITQTNNISRFQYMRKLIKILKRQNE